MPALGFTGGCEDTVSSVTLAIMLIPYGLGPYEQPNLDHARSGCNRGRVDEHGLVGVKNHE